jgi:hypothetical protein
MNQPQAPTPETISDADATPLKGVYPTHKSWCFCGRLTLNVMKKPSRISLLAGIGLAAAVLPNLAKAECWSHYRSTTLPQHVAEFPLADYRHWNHYALSDKDGVNFSNSFLGKTPDGVEAAIPLRFSAEIRPASKFARQAVHFFGGEEVSKLFTHELHVAEQGFDGWILVQDVLLPHLKYELQKGDGFLACLVLIGRTATYQLYILNEFDKLETDKPLKPIR